MIHEFDFSTNPYNNHECDAVTEGDWVVFRCPICKDYERKINVITGETKVKNLSSTVSHSGRHLASQYGAMRANEALN
jgi:hypothetical protein